MSRRKLTESSFVYLVFYLFFFVDGNVKSKEKFAASLTFDHKGANLSPRYKTDRNENFNKDEENILQTFFFLDLTEIQFRIRKKRCERNAVGR
jgi:hypothetical protein